MKLKSPSPQDDLILCELIHQVQKATPKPGSEQDVTTYISGPMWKAFCRSIKMPENSRPTEWLGIHKTNRVFGSKTIIIKSNGMISWSFAHSTIKHP